METERDVVTGTPCSYAAPALVMHGSVAEVTGAQAAGQITDMAFPAGTPVQDLTFSGI